MDVLFRPGKLLNEIFPLCHELVLLGATTQQFRAMFQQAGKVSGVLEQLVSLNTLGIGDRGLLYGRMANCMHWKPVSWACINLSLPAHCRTHYSRKYCIILRYTSPYFTSLALPWFCALRLFTSTAHAARHSEWARRSARPLLGHSMQLQYHTASHVSLLNEHRFPNSRIPLTRRPDRSGLQPRGLQPSSPAEQHVPRPTYDTLMPPW